MVTIVSLQEPSGHQRALFDSWAQVYEEAGRRILGETQTAWTADELRRLWVDPDRKRVGWAAVEDGVVVGAGELVLPMLDNLSLALVNLAVHPYHWRRGIGGQLLAEVERAAASRGRTILVAETEWLAGARDKSGEEFAARFGYAAAQTVLRSTLALPADRARLASIVARPGAEAYSMETWWDGVPEAWLDGRADLSRRMSTDVPLGDVRLEQEVWDAARVRHQYERVGAMRRRIVETFAVERGTGRLVGYTQIQVPLDRPEVCYQQDTLVIPEHRGHGLGLRLKVANALALMDEVPGATAVRTWNADDNTPMLDVNRAVGFVIDAQLREWQKELPRPA